MFIRCYCELHQRIFGGHINALSAFYGMNERYFHADLIGTEQVRRALTERLPAALVRAKADLMKMDLPSADADKLTNGLPSVRDGQPRNLSDLIHGCSWLAGFDASATLQQALAMDRIVQVVVAHPEDPDVWILAVRADAELQALDWSWLGEHSGGLIEIFSLFPKISADQRKILLGAIEKGAWLRLMALWDIEMVAGYRVSGRQGPTRYLPDLPTFAALLPRTTRPFQEGDLARGLLSLPFSRLLDVMWAALRFRDSGGRWPAAPPKPAALEQMFGRAFGYDGDARSRIKAIRNGEKQVDREQFYALLLGASSVAEKVELPIPLPWFVAAHLWEILFVKFHPHRPKVQTVWIDAQEIGYNAVWLAERSKLGPLPETRPDWPNWLSPPKKEDASQACRNESGTRPFQ